MKKFKLIFCFDEHYTNIPVNTTASQKAKHAVIVIKTV